MEFRHGLHLDRSHDELPQDLPGAYRIAPQNLAPSGEGRLQFSECPGHIQLPQAVACLYCRDSAVEPLTFCLQDRDLLQDRPGQLPVSHGLDQSGDLPLRLCRPQRLKTPGMPSSTGHTRWVALRVRKPAPLALRQLAA